MVGWLDMVIPYSIGELGIIGARWLGPRGPHGVSPSVSRAACRLYPLPGYVGVDGGLGLLECEAAAGHAADVLAGVLHVPVGDAAVAQVDGIAGPAPGQVPQVPGLAGLAARHGPHGPA